jgi:hypothetical protein
VVGCCEPDNEPSGFKNGGKFLDQLSGYQLLKETFLRAVSGSELYNHHF